jgi:hypothetical protein
MTLSNNNKAWGFYASIGRQQADAEQAYTDPSSGRPAQAELFGKHLGRASRRTRQAGESAG